jgi:hypothetical protein
MLRFSFDGKRIRVFDRLTRRIRTDVPRNVAVESEFNSVRKSSGAKDRVVEARLAELDHAAGECLDKLERHESLTREERWCLAFFIGFSEARGRGFRDSVLAEMPEPIDYSQPERGFVSERAARAFSAMVGVELDPWTIESFVIDDMRDVVSGAYELGAMAERGFEIARYAFAAEWCVAEAPRDAEFVSSDRPVAIIRSGKWFGDDPQDDAFIKAVPISPRKALIFRGSGGGQRLQHEQFGKAVVHAVNAAIAYRYDRNIFATSQSAIEQALSDSLVLQCSSLGVRPQAVLRTA